VDGQQAIPLAVQHTTSFVLFLPSEDCSLDWNICLGCLHGAAV